jgi:hypothetical protein
VVLAEMTLDVIRSRSLEYGEGVEQVGLFG